MRIWSWAKTSAIFLYYILAVGTGFRSELYILFLSPLYLLNMDGNLYKKIYDSENEVVMK